MLSLARGSLAFGAFAIALSLLPIGLAACLLALTARRGPALRALGLDLVTSSGAVAGRPRIFFRNLVAWSPLLLPFAYGVAAGATSPYALGQILGRTFNGTWALMIPALSLIGLAIAIWNPQRSLQDRIAGTHLVPR
jgi:hypothetical protein